MCKLTGNFKVRDQYRVDPGNESKYEEKYADDENRDNRIPSRKRTYINNSR